MYPVFRQQCLLRKRERFIYIAPDTFGSIQDAYTTKVVKDVLDQERDIDLVVLNGDIISRDNIFAHNSTRYMDKAVAPIIARNLTWASTYGNHESNYVRSTAAILRREHIWPNARTASMVWSHRGTDVGSTNYHLPVYSSKCHHLHVRHRCTPELILWFFDSRFGNKYQKLDNDGDFISRENWVHEDVVDWFQSENTRLTSRYRKSIPAITFVHMHPSKTPSGHQ
jgi:hypothetical protein